MSLRQRLRQEVGLLRRLLGLGRMLMDQLLARWSIAADRAIEVRPVGLEARRPARGGGTRRRG
jgi:hypothetical protein